MDKFYIVCKYAGEWCVKKGDDERIIRAIRNRKQEAIEVAVNLALNHRRGIIIHKKDGMIQKTLTFKEVKEKYMIRW